MPLNIGIKKGKKTETYEDFWADILEIKTEIAIAEYDSPPLKSTSAERPDDERK